MNNKKWDDVRLLTEQELELEMEKYIEQIVPGEHEDISWESESGSDTDDNIEAFLPSETE